MKILVLQIAKPAENLLAWPALRALRRTQPQAEIHVLTNAALAESLRLWNVANQIHVMPSTDLLEPLLQNKPSDREEMTVMADLTSQLAAENYDRIINLSFSALSSWIAHLVAKPNTQVLGYSRHADGWLHVADDVSAYIFAQAGNDRANRVHLTDLFASLIDVDLIGEDWDLDEVAAKDFGLPENYVVLPLSVARANQNMPGFFWSRILKHYSDIDAHATVVLAGTAEESALANEIRAQAPGTRIVDLTGQTQIEDLFALIAGAKAVLSASDLGTQIASLTGTKTLSLALTGTNFWETGPKAIGSCVSSVTKVEEFSSENLGLALAQMAQAIPGEAAENLIQHTGGVPAYVLPAGVVDRKLFGWQLVQALYLGGEFPMVNELPFVQAVEKLREMNQVVIEQLRTLSLDSTHLGKLMDRADEVMEAIVKMVADSGVLVRWVKTQKSRIVPASRAEVRQAMLEIHTQFGNVLKLYSFEAAEEKEKNRGSV
jgi:ADP-heptose:LPS heptosyltransferase